MKEHPRIIEAKKNLKSHIKFLESLLTHIRKGEEPYLSGALWAELAISKYFNDHLINDITGHMEGKSENL